MRIDKYKIKMKVAVIGAGKVGSIIVKGALRNNIDVIIGSRSGKSSLEDVKGYSINEALALADTIVIAIPGSETSRFFFEYKEKLIGKVIIDVTNDIKSKPFHHAKDAIGLRYVRAFSMLGFEVMASPILDGQQVDMLYVANETEQEITEKLILAAGLRPILVGGIDKADIIDNILHLWGTLAAQYKSRYIAFKVLGLTDILPQND